MNHAPVKNQLLIHKHYGECIAVQAWNEKETVCFVTAQGRRQILMNAFLEPVLGPGRYDTNICVIDQKDVDALELRLSKEGSID